MSMRSVSKTARPYDPLTRQERVIIRMLCRCGTTIPPIANEIDCSMRSVYRLLNRDRIICVTDHGDDWDLVDKEFKKKYPRPPMDATAALPRRIGSKQSSSRMSNQITLENVRSFAHQVGLINTIGGEMSLTVPTTSGHTIKKEESEATHREPQFHDGERGGGDETAPSLPDLDKFLNHLEHDMSGLFGTLEARDLGTSKKFFAFAEWDDIRLHDLFKATFPDLTTPQRLMLVNGLV
ncbi:hypothetical protein DXG01_006190 [Tephrocybe rancida]|nr:hypothetical protein DXG01_006190 [Tephrocybe rancida]